MQTLSEQSSKARRLASTSSTEAERRGERTDVVSLIEHDDTLRTEFLRDLFGDFRIEKVVEGVDDDVHEGHLLVRTSSRGSALVREGTRRDDSTHHSTKSEIRTDPFLPPIILDILEREHSFREQISGFTSPKFLRAVGREIKMSVKGRREGGRRAERTS